MSSLSPGGQKFWDVGRYGGDMFEDGRAFEVWGWSFGRVLTWEVRGTYAGEGGYFVELASRGEIRRINGIPREPRNLRSGQPKVESALKDEVD
ncbi:hypothetical protein BOTCAL_0089g00040 [Botryotinia calthae]|uniref:Uncharacterized protein n=1 Tax=Botryotinia calthae TaxID=38488 RepID=A0A4Y8D731_9HELO|nr:hypothetical protein BOTCAL_0089g00040 [Botryotinia calthae]